MTKNLSKTWPCVFTGRLIRDEVDPRVQATWKQYTHRSAPFGELRRLWRSEHCRTINPYGSEHCPYREADCAIAFLRGAQSAAIAARSSPKGYFRAFARNDAARRADEKPLARDSIRTNGPQGPGDTAPSGDGDEAGPLGLRGPGHRPQRIGELLGSLDLGPHQRRTPDEQEGSK